MTRDWPLRTVPQHLVDSYLDAGWWSDHTVGTTVAAAMDRLSDARFTVRSAVRPWQGTFLDIDRAARAFAATLHARGVRSGDVIAFQLPNWVEAAITFWGSAYLGAVVVPIVHFYGAKEVSYIVRTLRPDVVISADRFRRTRYLDTYVDLLGEGVIGSWYVVGNAPVADLPPGAQPFETLLDHDPISGPLETDPDAPAIVAFTSGTTRDPKGVIHSHRTILAETGHLNQISPAVGPPALVAAPVGHFMGMTNALLLPLRRQGGSVNLIDVWDPATVLHAMRDEGLGMPGGSPYFLTTLLDHPECTSEHVALIPYIGLGGSTVPRAVAERAEKLGITVYRSYGSTEHPSITGSLLDEPQAKRLTTDGHALDGVEIRLDDAGEILSRGPDCFLGYTDPELTARFVDADGWYRTGDIGTVDADGYLTITDRISDVIIRGGENISAQEVEEALLGMDSVSDVSVVGVPDERYGERAAAVIRPNAPGVAPTLAQIQQHLGAVGLARQKWPELIHELDEFPRTASGKVQKFRLRELLRAGVSEER